MPGQTFQGVWVVVSGTGELEQLGGWDFKQTGNVSSYSEEIEFNLKMMTMGMRKRMARELNWSKN